MAKHSKIMQDVGQHGIDRSRAIEAIGLPRESADRKNGGTFLRIVVSVGLRRDLPCEGLSSNFT